MVTLLPEIKPLRFSKSQQDEKNSFLYFNSDLKIYHFPFSIPKRLSTLKVRSSRFKSALITYEINNELVRHKVLQSSVGQHKRASEPGIRRSSVRFLLRTQNFSLSYASVKTKKKRTLFISKMK